MAVYRYVEDTTTIIDSDNTLVDVLTSNYSNLKTLVANYYLNKSTVNMSVEYQTHYYDRFVNLRIYINGVDTGITTGNVYSHLGMTKWSFQVENISNNDNISVYGKNDSGVPDWWGKIQNFRMYGLLIETAVPVLPVRGRGWIVNY